MRPRVSAFVCEGVNGGKLTQKSSPWVTEAGQHHLTRSK